MEEMQGTVRPRGADTLRIAAVLLVIQGAVGYLSALGLVFFAIVTRSPVWGVGLAVALGVPSVAMALAAGVARCRRLARIGVLVLESLLLISALLHQLLSLLVGAGVAFDLVTLLTTVVVPAATASLLLTPSARRAVAQSATRRPAKMVQFSVPASSTQGGKKKSGAVG